ncbi:hypothetical protein D3C87_1305900 [compost metagenome]
MAKGSKGKLRYLRSLYPYNRISRIQYFITRLVGKHRSNRELRATFNMYDGCKHINWENCSVQNI